MHGKKGERPLYIRAYYGCYDPLSYPLFFPRGEIGWNRWMPYVGPSDDRTHHSSDNTTPQGNQYIDIHIGMCSLTRVRLAIINVNFCFHLSIRGKLD